MNMLPIFIIGLVVGSGVTAIIMANLKNIPSVVKLTSLENQLASQKQDIEILVNENKTLQEKLQKEKRKNYRMRHKVRKETEK